MNPVKVFTDSPADLTKELVSRYNLGIIPFYVLLDGVSYRDGVDIDADMLFKFIDEKGKLPSTSAVPPIIYENAFKPWIEDGYDVIYIGLSSGLTSSLENAKSAASAFDKGRVYIIDSLSLSTGIGLLTLKAAEYAADGMDAKTIFERVSKIVPRVRASFVIDTLDYLCMGGRCTPLQKWASSVFKIHPRIIVTEEGKMTVGEKFKGKRSIVLNGLLETAVLKKDRIEPQRVFITHSGCPQEELDFLADGLKTAIPELQEVLMTRAGCTISTHCGPKTVGILYIEKE